MKPAELLKELNQCPPSKLPSVEIGDKVIVTTKHSSALAERILSFKGVVIGQRNVNQISHTFKVLKESDKIVVTAVFPYYSPSLVSIKKIGKIAVKRAKLYFLERRLCKKKENE